MGPLERLKAQIDAIDKLGHASSASPEFVAWRKETEGVLEALFGGDSVEVQDFNAIYYTPVFLSCRMGDEAFEEAYRNGLEEARSLLAAWIDQIRQKRA